MWSPEELETLFEAIFYRKSVRKYKPDALPEERLEEILGKTGELYPLLPDSPLAFRILSAKDIKGINPAKAPHFLALYTGKDPGSIISASFALHQVSLWLSAQGLGNCWLGMPSPAKEWAEAGGLPFHIMLAFGQADEAPRRNDISQFKRKPFDEITDLQGLPMLLEPVRLAPSGVNRQPWFLQGDERAIRLCGKENKLVSKALFGEAPTTDMGIALCHLWLSALHSGCFGSLERESSQPAAPAGYQYCWTLHLK